MKKLSLLLIIPVVLAGCHQVSSESQVSESTKIDMSTVKDAKDNKAKKDSKQKNNAKQEEVNTDSETETESHAEKEQTDQSKEVSSSEKLNLTSEEETNILDRIADIAKLDDLSKYTFVINPDEEKDWVQVEVRTLSGDAHTSLYNIYRYNTVMGDYQVYNLETDTFE